MHAPAILALVALSLAAPVRASTSSLQAGSDSPASPQPASGFDSEAFEAWHWRQVGPFRGGRSAAVCGLRDEPDTYYFGAAGGGVWKTGDGGKSWDNVSDGHFGGSIGAVAVSDWDPNVVWVGAGEVTVRGNVSHGDGVWRSTDAGKTWSHAGLSDSRHIPRIRVHPRDPDTVWVAALGHLSGPNEERGVYKTTDGGASWERVLFVSDEVGCVDLALDPTNPRILYATMWRVLRTPYSLESGGPGCGIWKTSDAGATWSELSGSPGLPKGTLGIAGITVSPSNPENLYAIVEAEEGGVFRSQDAGESWSRTNSSRSLRQRAWYYSRIEADPLDEDTVYVMNVGFHRSQDGGKTFGDVSTPHSDNHDLWIAPDDSARMIQANDGGANVSYDRGRSWSSQENQPTAQMYRVSVDDDFPYRLLGAQQDNSTLRLRSRSLRGGSIGVRDWEPTAGGESGQVVAQPGRPQVVYGGSYGGTLTRVDHLTGERRSVHVWPDDPMGWGAAELTYRFNWNFPLLFSPHDPERLYAAANVLFATSDEGRSWTAISPDLTRDDKHKMGPSGGPITKDNTSVEYYGTIFAIAESPLEQGVIWCGSDDGLVHLTRDAGLSWTNVTPPDCPEWTQINSIEADPFDSGSAYIAATSYKLDDYSPYLFRTDDHGASWTRIDAGIERDYFTRVVRADPLREGLLYAGTERGVYVSFDDGAQWQALQLDLPVVPVTDLLVKDGDLVCATQGRGYWILDDLSPLRQWRAELAGTLHLFEPRTALRVAARRAENPRDAGTNPYTGIIVDYLLPEQPPEQPAPEQDDPAPAQDADADADRPDADEQPPRPKGPAIKLEFLEADGTLIREFTPEPQPGEQPKPLPKHQADDGRQLPTEVGFNRFAWDLRYPGAEKFDGMVLWNGRLSGPRAIPGRYLVRLTVGDQLRESPVVLQPDPRTSATPEDFRAQHEFLIQVRDDLTRTHRAIRRLRDVRQQLQNLEARVTRTETTGALLDEAQAIIEQIQAVEDTLYQTQSESPQDPLNFPIRLNDKLAGLRSDADQGDFAPTSQAVLVRTEITRAIEAELSKLDSVWNQRLPAFNALALELAIPAILPEKADEPAQDDQAQEPEQE